MTKKKLIKFLELFADDIKILLYNEEHNYRDNGLSDIELKYRIAKMSIQELRLAYKDGYIVIR